MSQLAQSTVTSTNLCDATGTPIASATISFTPVLSDGTVTSFRYGGTTGGQVAAEAVSAQVVNGAFSIVLADTSLTDPVNVGYRVCVTDNVSGAQLLGPGYNFFQPTGAFVNFDQYAPNLTGQVTVQVGPQGPPGVPGRDAIATTFNIGNLSQVVPQAASQSGLTVQANAVIDANHNLFSDGTDYWSAGPFYAAQGAYIDDTALTMIANPAKFSALQVLNIFLKFIRATNANGEIPIAIPQNLASVPIYYSAWDQHQAYATGDGWIQAPQLLFLYWLKTGDLTYYTEYVGAIRTALARIPRNAANHLLTVVPGNEYVCGFAFMEYMRNTGDVANGNVWYCRVCQVMLAMATSAADAANIAFFTAELANVTAGIQSTLIDSATGMLKAATGNNSANLDIISSTLAVYIGILTAPQALTIANYCLANYATLVNANGYILQTPNVGGWAVVGPISPGGGAPYPASPFTSTQYQGGYWSVHFAWFANALAKVSLPKVAVLLNTFLNGVDPGTEYYNQGSAAPAGTSPNLESPQGAQLAMTLFPSLLTVNAGNAVVNQYGALVNNPSAPVACGAITATGRVALGTAFAPTATPTHQIIANWANQVVDVVNASPQGASAIAFFEGSDVSAGGIGHGGIGGGNSLNANVGLRNSTYVYSNPGQPLILTANIATWAAGAGNGLTINEQGTTSGFGFTGTFFDVVSGATYSNSVLGSGGVVLLANNVHIDPVTGFESLIVGTQPGLRLALILPTGLVLQTTPAGGVGSSSGLVWTTIKTLN